MEKSVMIIIAVVAVLIIIGVIVALKNKSSDDGADTGPQAHVDSASDSAQQAAAVSAAAADAAANASTPQEAAAATQHAADASAVAQQAAASANQTAQQTAQQAASGTPVPDVDCVLNDWGDWGPCIDETFQTRLRTIKVQPSGNGKACDTLVDKRECGPTFVDGINQCPGFRENTAPSATNPIPLACHQLVWKKFCSKPFVESDWPPNYRTFPSSTIHWLANEAITRCNPTPAPSTPAPSTPAPSTPAPSTPAPSTDACAGYTAGSTTKPIPLACHQQIWKKYCAVPLNESDWAPNYRTLPAVTVDWLDADAKARSTSTQWKSHCNITTTSDVVNAAFGTVTIDRCAGFTPTTAPSATNPIPLACHQQIWRKYCSKPLVESDWAPNYRTFPSSTTKWLDDDAKVRSTHPTWKSHCN